MAVNGLAQHPEAKRANIWYFGNDAGLDFSSGTAVAITNGVLNSIESCASISDLNGNLLFYTDGDTVWDKNHNVMPNGFGLLGRCLSIGNSSAQVLITPYPENNALYYIFTTDCGENLGTYGFNYSIVDISLNGGNGDIALKNQLLFSPSNEGVTAIYNCNLDTIWVVSHKYNTNDFYVYLINNQGLLTLPIVNSQGIITTYGGQMKFSPNGKKLFYFGYIYDFDLKTGVISNAISQNAFVDGYGVSFSPDSKKIYISLSGNLIIQYNIDTTNIIASYKEIYNGVDNSEYWGLQLGIDNKVYIAAYDTAKVSTIDNPNNSGVTANFNPYSVDLNGRKSQFAFPSFVESYFDQTYHPDSCTFDTLPTTPPDTIQLYTDTLMIPNIFTPNNDGINDVFNIILKGYEKIIWRIYNRWGDKLKMGELKIENDGSIELWNGRTIAGEKVSDGTYYYIINLTKKGGKNETKKGFVQILH